MSNADAFIHNCKKLVTSTYLASKNWSLNLYEDPSINGPIVYFWDTHTGYKHVLTLLPDSKGVALNKDEIESVVWVVRTLVKNNQIKRLNANDHEKLSRALAGYALASQNYRLARSQYGECFSFYILGRKARNGYELRPFSTSHKTLMSPEEIEPIFVRVDRMFPVS